MLQLLSNITSKHSYTLENFLPLAGGDSNEVYLLKCTQRELVIKLNVAAHFPSMFAAEANGLQLLKNSKSFRIPEVVAFGALNNKSYLLLEYIPTSQDSRVFCTQFAEQLSLLHQTTAAQFGLDHDNFIGSLPQYNTQNKTASEFFILQRLEPQFKLAYNNGFKFTALDILYKNISEIIPDEPPSLIHGDLWNGNYLLSQTQEAILIDPAVAFAPREMDLAMMRLFGGFPENIFSIYNEIFPLEANYKSRISLFQLYYLLVHLNLFGKIYQSQVVNILKMYH